MFTFVIVGVAAPVEGNGVVWIELDRLIQVLDGAVVLPLAAIGIAAVAECQGKVWIKLDRLIEILDGAVVFGFAEIGVAAIAESRRQILTLAFGGLDDGRAGGDLG